MKKIRLILAAAAALTYGAASACTNFIVTRGASTDGSVMVTYAADSHALYGALYHTPGGKHKSGAMLPVYEWDTGRYLTDIPQVRETWSTIGNMNEHSLIIGETTYGGRPELEDSTGRMDYGSLIYITLQRAKTAREAIGVIAELADTYGYASSGESFSIADPDEAWIMELIGKGFKDDGKGDNARKGIVWVARRIPDGYVSAHANQARITTFPKDDPENCLYSPDVISFAREMGYYDGPDADFSFSDAYAPLDFGGMRACEARVWAFFRTVADDMDRYTDYAMGHNKNNRMPLWVKPRAKVSPKTLFDCMRDHYEGTPMDMTADLGAGGHNCPYRWRPMEFEVDGVKYVNERATATQQTGFWFVAQARPDVTRDMGILWFGVDDAATSCLTPIFCSAQEVPGCFREDNGSMLEYSPTSAFWLFNRTTNFAYMRYDMISADIRKVTDKWENDMLRNVQALNARVGKMSPEARRSHLTQLSVETAQQLFDRWQRLNNYLLVKYMDGNVKSEHGDVLTFLDGDGSAAHFVDNGNGKQIPGKIQFPGYNEKWKRAVAKDNGEILKVVK
uniref:C69 family dipeptidase n=1 Tax=Alistipes shahii TaxID=328814 RepID=UPI003FEF1356